MDWAVLIIGILFFLAGITFIFFSRRFIKWFAGYKFEHNLNYGIPEGNRGTSALSKKEYIKNIFHGKGFTRTFLHVWLVSIRILGSMLTLAGIFLLGHAFFNL
ncbi:hypothetical protein ACFLXY_09580 [Chloroflexota bacterium]